jgi:hypothetical protein
VRPLFAKGRLVRPFAFLTRPSRRVFLLAQAKMKKVNWTLLIVALIHAFTAITVAAIHAHEAITVAQIQHLLH